MVGSLVLSSALAASAAALSEYGVQLLLAPSAHPYSPCVTVPSLDWTVLDLVELFYCAALISPLTRGGLRCHCWMDNRKYPEIRGLRSITEIVGLLGYLGLLHIIIGVAKFPQW